MRTAALAQTVLIAEQSGDRPAIITKVFSNTSVEVCAFTPLPEHIKVVTLHQDRREAIAASLKDSRFHGYWPTQA